MFPRKVNVTTFAVRKGDLSPLKSAASNGYPHKVNVTRFASPEG